ncbi:hypothetical protein AB0M05_28190 [Streptomyces violaceusniger]|uniref:hypothetical protein n=1 Tax=Streptomyces violaceusniger TaxID=68280 RepID=UPI00344999B5
MTSLNELEERHIASMAQLRSADSIEVIDEALGGVGLGFGDIRPLDAFNPDWGNLRLTPEMLETSLRFSEIAAHWESVSPLPELSGEYRVPAPLDILSQGPSLMADMLSDEFQQDFAAELRYIDNAYNSGRGFMTYLHMAPGSPSLDVWFQDLVSKQFPPYPPGFFKLDLTYNTYVEALVLSKGLHGWQYLFADISFTKRPFKKYGESLRNGFDVFAQLFPDLDYSPLIERLEARL